MKTLQILLTIPFFLFFLGLSSNLLAQCTCASIYDPVCANGVTYGNSCEAECDGFFNWTAGECGCTCTAVYDPVCANGVTYGNSCEAECDGFFNWTPGECGCTCTAVYDPVCANGVTYGNSCEAECDGFFNWTPGECGCTCTAVYDPVCANGVTYGNSCEAECDGFFNWTPGECGNNNLPNLVIGSGASCNYTTSGDVVSFTIPFTNNGTISSSSTNACMYLSTAANDSSIGYGNPIYLACVNVPSIGAGQTYNVSISSDICNFNVPSGTYGLGIVIDQNQSVTESNDSFDDNSGYCASAITWTNDCNTGGNPSFSFSDLLMCENVQVNSPYLPINEKYTFEEGEQTYTWGELINLSEGTIYCQFEWVSPNGNVWVTDNSQADVPPGGWGWYRASFFRTDLFSGQWTVRFYAGYNPNNLTFQSSVDFTVSGGGGSSNESISVAPNSPDACDNINITASGEFSNGCPFIASSNYTITGNTINLNLTTGSSSPPCTFAIEPWSETLNIGMLNAGFYNVRLFMDGSLASSSSFNVATCGGCNTIPSITQTIDKGHTFAQIRFQQNNAAQSYKLRWRPQGSFTWTTIDLEEISVIQEWHYYPIAPPCYCPENCLLLPAFSFPDQVDIRGLNPCTSYDFQIASVCTNGDLSDYSSSYTITTEECNNTYYTNNKFSVGMYPDYGRISHFEIDNIGYDFDEHSNGNSYCDDCNGCPKPYDGYNYFSNRTIPLSPGDIVGSEGCADRFMDLWLEADGSDLQDWYVDIWIDYNRDGDFNDNGENAYSFFQNGVLQGQCLVAFNNCEFFTVPNNAQIGNTRLRISISQGTDADHDDVFNFGHVFDFPVSMQNAVDPCENFFATSAAVNAVCSTPGSVAISANSGQSPYSYNIGNGNQSPNFFDNLSPGNYVVTVTDANACIVNTTFTIANNTNNLSVSINDEQLTCTNNFVTLNPNINGAAPPFSYLWSNGSTAASITTDFAGTYSLTVSDSNGCSEITSAVVTIDADFPSVNTVSNNPTCGNSNGSISASVSGGSGLYSYDWQNPNGQIIGSQANINNLSEGNYILVVRDLNSGCETQSFVELSNENALPNTSFNIISNIDGQVSLNNTTTNASNYYWDMGDGITLTEFEPSYMYSESGQYTICLQSENVACGITSSVCETINISLPMSNVPWTFEMTEFNHNVILIEELVSDINGQPLESGDYVGFFYEHNGQEFCAGFDQWTGIGSVFITIYGNDENLPNKNGFDIGEVFRVKVWRSATEEEINVTANYLPIGSFDGLASATNLFESDGVSIIDELSSRTCMTINLEEGTQLISSYIIPTNANMEQVLAPIWDDIAVFQNDEGEGIVPTFNINEIGNWEVEEAYKVNMNTATSLEICGQKVEPSTTPITIEEGIQWIAYLKENTSSIEDQLASAEDCITWVKNQEGDIYAPILGGGSLSEMQPTQGYKLKAKCSDAILYSSNLNEDDNEIAQSISSESTSLEKNNSLEFYSKATNTGREAALVLPKEKIEHLLEIGDELAAFTNQGMLCGAAKYKGNNTFMTLWGDDTSTTEKEGFEVGEKIHLRFWDASKKQESTLEVLLENGTFHFSKDAFFIIAEILALTNIENIEDINTNWEIYPNPANQELTIEWKNTFDENVQIEIFTNKGLITQVYTIEKGTSKINIDLRDLSSGLYWCRLQTEKVSSVKRLVILK